MRYENLARILGVADYKIGESGTVWRWSAPDGVASGRWTVVPPETGPTRQKMVRLYVYGVLHYLPVAHLVLRAFGVPPPDGARKPRVRFLDGDEWNCALSNLEWRRTPPRLTSRRRTTPEEQAAIYAEVEGGKSQGDVAAARGLHPRTVHGIVARLRREREGAGKKTTKS